MTEYVSHDAVVNALDWTDLIEQLRDWFTTANVNAPPRQVLTVPAPEESNSHQSGSLLIMPAWLPGKSVGVKVVTFFPWNADLGQPTINAGYMLFDGSSGKLTSILDGDALTERRTAAASALAADYLARKDAKQHLIIGTGQLAKAVGEAYVRIRPISKTIVWGRRPEKAEEIVRDLRSAGIQAETAPDLEEACARADIVTTVTASKQPVVLGNWLRPGTHLDLIGSFRADMRECDDQAVAQAELFVDDWAGASQAGDLSQPLEAGLIGKKDVAADLRELCRGAHPGRRDETSYTLFKSAGLSLEDLAAASLAQEKRK